jgi:ureidoacrylate peracid hydrolase
MLRTLEDKVAPGHSALVVVDMQNDMCSPQGSFARMGIDVSGLAALAPSVARLAAGAKDAGVLSIYTRVSDRERLTISDAYHEVNLAFYERHMRRRAEDGGATPWAETAWGEDLFHPIQAGPEDVVLLKHRFGAFVHTKLDQILRSNNIRTLVFAGVLTDVCVESTARAAIDLDYYVVVVGDCTATLSEERQRASLGIMADIIGVVVTADEILEVWNASGRRAPA